MKKITPFLFYLFLAAHHLYAQERPAGYFTSVLSSYDYRGLTIQKGDKLYFKDGRQVAVKEIQKYEIGGAVAYYVNGRDEQDREVWYAIADMVDKEALVLPLGTPPGDKVSYGSLPVVNGKIIYEYLGEAAGMPKAKLFDQVLSQLAHLVSARQEGLSVQFAGKEEGHIMAQAGFSLPYGKATAEGSREMRFSYVVDIRIKDGRYKLNLDGFTAQVHSVKGNRAAYPVSMYTISNSPQQRDQEVMTQFDARNRAFMQHFAKTLSSSADDDSW